MSRQLRFDANPSSLIQARKSTGPRKRRLPKPLKAAFPHSAERQYAKDIKNFVQRARELVSQILVPRLPSLLAQAKFHTPSRVRQDDVVDDFAAILQEIRNRLGYEFTDSILATIAQRMGVSIEQIIQANARRQWEHYQGYGLKLGQVSTSGEIQSLLQMKIRENVRLITTMSNRHFESLESEILGAITKGSRVEDIESVIDDRFASMESNAELIARDQVGKINGQLTEITQTQLGVSRYRWRGVGDQRERTSHRDLEGEVFSWDDPPVVDGERVHPGEAIQCRCFAEPVMEDLL